MCSGGTADWDNFSKKKTVTSSVWKFQPRESVLCLSQRYLFPQNFQRVHFEKLWFFFWLMLALMSYNQRFWVQTMKRIVLVSSADTSAFVQGRKFGLKFFSIESWRLREYEQNVLTFFLLTCAMISAAYPISKLSLLEGSSFFCVYSNLSKCILDHYTQTWSLHQYEDMYHLF